MFPGDTPTVWFVWSAFLFACGSHIYHIMKRRIAIASSIMYNDIRLIVQSYPGMTVEWMRPEDVD